MKLLSKLVMLSMSFALSYGTAFANNESDGLEIGKIRVLSKAVEGDEAVMLTAVLFQRMQEYYPILTDAIQSKDLSKIEMIVEKDSPWYQMLQACKEGNDFNMPSIVGSIPYYPLAIFSFLVAAQIFDEGKDSIKVFQDEDLYEFQLEGVSIYARYKNGVMKFYRLRSPEIAQLHAQQLF